MPDDTDVVEAPEAVVASETRPVILEERRPAFGVFFWICSAWLFALTFVTIFAPLLPFQDPQNSDFIGAGPNADPSWGHLLGTDELARDILSRLVYGARVSLVIGLCATIIGMVVGGGLGMFSAYLRGRVDDALTLFMYSGLAFPAIIAVVAILSFWGRSELKIILVLGLFSVPLIFRLVRSATLASATKEYVTAAKSQGATSTRVLSHDIFPIVAPTLIAYTVFTLGGIIATEGALAFIGLSVQLPTPSWGNMISEASQLAPDNLALLFAPAIALFLTLVSLNVIGERLRVRFDTTESKL